MKFKIGDEVAFKNCGVIGGANNTCRICNSSCEVRGAENWAGDYVIAKVTGTRGNSRLLVEFEANGNTWHIPLNEAQLKDVDETKVENKIW